MGLAGSQGSELEDPWNAGPWGEVLGGSGRRFKTAVGREVALLTPFWELSFASCCVKLLLCVGCFVVMSVVPAMCPEEGVSVASYRGGPEAQRGEG